MDIRMVQCGWSTSNVRLLCSLLARSWTNKHGEMGSIRARKVASSQGKINRMLKPPAIYRSNLMERWCRKRISGDNADELISDWE